MDMKEQTDFFSNKTFRIHLRAADSELVKLAFQALALGKDDRLVLETSASLQGLCFTLKVTKK